MGVENSDNSDTPAMEGALEALLEVARASDVENDWPIPTKVFTRGDYEVIIRAAWRHQFNQDRSSFKKSVRDLEEQLVPRLVASRDKDDTQGEGDSE